MGCGEGAVPIGELLEERRHLLDVACWMLGSGPAAERVIDETYRQWYELSEPARERITAPRSWLARVAGGICLSRLALPEQVTEVLLEAVDSLSPAERALFVLGDVPGDVPGMAGGGIADIVRQRGPASAGPASAGPTERAGESLRARRARPTPPEQRDLLAVEVCRACVTQDETLLVSVLAPDVTAFFDGGGKVRALVKPVHGATQVARSLLALLARRPRTTVHTHSVNGRTGLLVRYDRQVAAVIGLDIAGPHVVQIWVVLNPDKLRGWH